MDHHAKNCVNSNKSNATYCVAHTAFQRHTMKTVANVVNVKIHAVTIHAQKIPSVPSIFHNMTHHLRQFAENVRSAFEIESLLGNSLMCLFVLQWLSPEIAQQHSIIPNAIWNATVMLTAAVIINAVQMDAVKCVFRPNRHMNVNHPTIKQRHAMKNDHRHHKYHKSRHQLYLKKEHLKN